MHSSKKGKQWYFGMKAHIGVDAESGLVHMVGRSPETIRSQMRIVFDKLAINNVVCWRRI